MSFDDKFYLNESQILSREEKLDFSMFEPKSQLDGTKIPVSEFSMGSQTDGIKPLKDYMDDNLVVDQTPGNEVLYINNFLNELSIQADIAHKLHTEFAEASESIAGYMA